MAAGRKPSAAGGLLTGLLIPCLLMPGLSCHRTTSLDRDGIVSGASVADLRGRVFQRRPVAVRLAEGWAASPDGTGWVLTVPGRLLVDLTEAIDTQLTISIEVDDGEFPGDLRTLWDGEPLPEPDVVAGRGRWVIVVGPESALPGLHEIVLRRTDDVGPRPSVRPSVEVSGIAFSADGETTELDPLRLLHDHSLIRIQSFGVLPDATGKMHSGGFVFDGPCTIRWTMSPPRAGRFRVTADNRSSASAVFFAENNGDRTLVEVAAGASAPFDVPLTSGANHLTFEVEGDEAGLFLWAQPRVIPAPADSMPPIVIITIDTTRRDVIPPYVDRRQLAPNIAEFADGATVYERAFATAPWTLPSHASIFTGLVPSRHGAGVTGIALESRFVTLAELLATRGYLTSGAAGGDMCAANRGLAQGFASYRDPDTNETRADSMTDGAIAWLEALDGETPFLFLNYFDPHYPYRAPEAYWSPGQEPLAPADGPPMTIGFLNKVVAEHGVLPTGLRQRLVAAYEAEVRFMDHEIGRLLSALDRLGLYETAFIAIVSDHGEMLGENGHLFHSYRLDPELVHIPYLVKWPFQKHPATVRAPVSLVDLFPTVLGVAGVGAIDSDGRVLPLTDADGRAATDTVVSEEHSQLELHPLSPQPQKIADHLWATASADAMTVVWDSGAQCLDLTDSWWRHSPCSPSRVDAAWTVVGDLGEPSTLDRPGSFPLSDAERKRLEALGYLR